MFMPHDQVLKKIGFTERFDKGRITTEKDFES